MKDIYVAAESRTIISSAVIGAVAGLLTWGLNLLLQKYFVEPVFCRSADNFAVCANGGTVSFNIALVLVAILSVVALVKVSGYRPLLVAIAAVVTFWGANQWLGVQAWWEASLWLAILMSIAYLMYSWIARVASFPVSVILMVIVVIAARFVIR